MVIIVNYVDSSRYLNLVTFMFHVFLVPRLSSPQGLNGFWWNLFNIPMRLRQKKSLEENTKQPAGFRPMLFGSVEQISLSIVTQFQRFFQDLLFGCINKQTLQLGFTSWLVAFEGISFNFPQQQQQQQQQQIKDKILLEGFLNSKPPIKR